MKRWTYAISIASWLAAAQVASAQETTPDVGKGRQLAPKRAAEIGVEGGYTQPFGTLTSGRSISDVAHAGGAVGLTYAYRIDPRWSIGVSGQFHESAASADLGPGAAVRGVATGVNATFHFLPFRTIDPYASLGTGYRFLFVAPRGANNNDMIHGWELGRAVGGVDFRVSRDVAMGPALGADVNLFLWDRLQATGTNEEITGAHPTTFVFAGVTGRFDIGGERVPERQRIARAAKPRGAPEPAAGPAIARPLRAAPLEPAAPPLPITLEASIPGACHVDAARVFFAPGAMTLDATNERLLSDVAVCLATGPLRGRKVTVVGHGDATGSDAFNLSLAAARARSVAELLRRRGVAASDITVISAGNRGATGRDLGSRAFDRRVEIELAQ